MDAAGDAVEREDHEGGVADEDDWEEGVHEGGGEDGGVLGEGGVGRGGGAVRIGDGRDAVLGGREVWWEDGGIRDVENGLFDQRNFSLQGFESAEFVGDSRLALAATSQLSSATFSLLVRFQGAVGSSGTASGQGVTFCHGYLGLDLTSLCLHRVVGHLVRNTVICRFASLDERIDLRVGPT